MSQDLEPADMGKRGFAAMIDYVAFYVLYVIAMTETLPEPVQVAAGAIAFVYLIVQAYFLTRRGQSLGKMAMSVRVVRMDGNEAGFVNAVLLRVVLNAFLCATGVYFVADNLAAFWREDKRCLHDLIAGTRVVAA